MAEFAKVLGLFPGQGSQKVGMGKDLHDRYDLAKKMFRDADDALGLPLSQICFEGPEERLTATEITQPAILTVSAIAYALAQEITGNKIELVAAAGHSLGEYSAHVAAKSIAFEDAVLLVHKRGKFMQGAVPAGQGRMVAVLGMEVALIEAALSQGKGVAEIANINAPGQVVVAGSVDGIDQFLKAAAGAKVRELAVSAPFHCSLMKPAEDLLGPELEKLSIQPSAFPVYANFSAKAVNEPKDIRENLRRQVCGRVRWVECMENAIAATTPQIALEFGAGNVLSGLLKRISSDLKRSTLGTAEELGTLS